MKELKGSTKAGRNIIERTLNYEGRDLRQVYGSYSYEKERAYNWCMEQYLKTENHDNFHICSHNTFGFTVSWTGTINGEDIVRYETKDNTYIVYLNK